MAAGYLPVDTPPGAAPLPLGKPASSNVQAPTVRGPQPPRIKRGPTSSGKGRMKKPTTRRGSR